VAADFVKDGVRCNAICPGTVESPSLRERLAATGDFDAAHAAFTARQPMGRFGTPDRNRRSWSPTSPSDAAAFTTGQAFAVDGGWSI
jgi:2-keto-3-deoxy-L-fuconate dehydrogenase